MSFHDFTTENYLGSHSCSLHGYGHHSYGRFAHLNRQYRSPINALIVFSAAALVVFHLMAIAFARFSDEKTYKIVDYIYLSFGLVGLVGVVNIQSDVAKENIAAIVQTNKDRLNKECSNKKDTRACEVLRQYAELLDKLVLHPAFVPSVFETLSKVFAKTGLGGSQMR